MSSFLGRVRPADGGAGQREGPPAEGEGGPGARSIPRPLVRQHDHPQVRFEFIHVLISMVGKHRFVS
jgi:hypothetical protein